MLKPVSAQLKQLFDEEWAFRLQENPTFATQAGERRYNDRLPKVKEEDFARRLQTQETMTAEIVQAIDATLHPRGIAVLVEAEHMCMSMRGIQKQGASTTTCQFTGIFRDDPAEQVRFFTLLNAGRRS